MKVNTLFAALTAACATLVSAAAQDQYTHLNVKIGQRFNASASLKTVPSYSFPQFNGSALALEKDGVTKSVVFYTFFPMVATNLTEINLTRRDGAVDHWLITVWPLPLEESHDKRVREDAVKDTISVEDGKSFFIQVEEGTHVDWEPVYLELARTTLGEEPKYFFKAMNAGETSIMLSGIENRRIKVRIAMPHPPPKRATEPFDSGVTNMSVIPCYRSNSSEGIPDAYANVERFCKEYDGQTFSYGQDVKTNYPVPGGRLAMSIMYLDSSNWTMDSKSCKSNFNAMVCSCTGGKDSGSCKTDLGGNGPLGNGTAHEKGAFIGASLNTENAVYYMRLNKSSSG